MTPVANKNAANVSVLPSRTDVVVPVWGERYWSLFVDYALPTHISQDNAEALRKLGARWRIFCRPGEYKMFAGSASMKRLASLFKVDIVDLEPLQDSRDTFQYSLMTRCHQQAICEAPEALIFVNPDQISSANSYSGVTDYVTQGYRAVMVQGLRMVREEFVEGVSTGRINLNKLEARKLCSLALSMMHPLNKAHLVRGQRNRSNGSYYWMAPGTGMLAHCFHLHPFFYWPIRPAIRVATTIDHELVRLGVRDYKRAIVVENSDLVLQCELSPRNHLIDYIDMEPIPLRVASDWAKDWTNWFHRGYFARPIVFRTGDRELNDTINQAAEHFVEQFASVLKNEFGRVLGQGMLVTKDHYRLEGEMFAKADAAAQA